MLFKEILGDCFKRSDCSSENEFVAEMYPMTAGLKLDPDFCAPLKLLTVEISIVLMSSEIPEPVSPAITTCIPAWTPPPSMRSSDKTPVERYKLLSFIV